MKDNAGENADKHPEHWDEYSNLQRTKHFLIKRYLGGWFNILGTTNRRIIYFDTHAGRGKYHGGQYGSPLVAIKTFLEHSRREAILRRCEVVFYFVERDPSNFASLLQEIEALGPLPKNLVAKPVREDCFKVLGEILQYLKTHQAILAPSFFFIDPYNFQVPGTMLKELMSFPGVELLINLMWRELDMQMHITDQPAVKKTIDELLLGEDWRPILQVESPDERAQKTINLLRQRIEAKWATYIFMLRNHNAIRYILLHLTKHDLGRDLIKDCLWKICPQACDDGTFFARKSEDYTQMQLINDEPDLRPLRGWLAEQLRGGPKRLQTLFLELRKEIWIKPQLNEVIRELKQEGTLIASEFVGRYSEKANPLLSMTPQV